MITVKNLRNSRPYKSFHIRVDRVSPLGNPFYMKNESMRDKVCDDYEVWLRECLSNPNSLQSKKIVFIEKVYEYYQKLELFCWCAPKRCHGDFIKKILLERRDENNS